MIGCAKLEGRLRKPVKKFTQLFAIIIKVCLLCFKVEEDRMDKEGATQKRSLLKLKTFFPALHFGHSKCSGPCGHDGAEKDESTICVADTRKPRIKAAK